MKLYIKKNLRGGIFQNIVMRVEHHAEVKTDEIGHLVKTKCPSYTHLRSDLGCFREAPESSEISYEMIPRETFRAQVANSNLQIR